MAYLAISAVFRTVVLSSGLILMLGIGGCIVGPPVQEMSNARQAIKAAVEAGASKGAAAQELTEAQKLLENAQVRFEGRAYREARVNALAAHGKAKKALSIAQATASVTSIKQPSQ
jgi:hypothetical protein